MIPTDKTFGHGGVVQSHPVACLFDGRLRTLVRWLREQFRRFFSVLSCLLAFATTRVLLRGNDDDRHMGRGIRGGQGVLL